MHRETVEGGCTSNEATFRSADAGAAKDAIQSGGNEGGPSSDAR